jgi:hypothetical protein
MAITYTSTIQHAQHRECITLTDSFGATMKLYVHAKEASARDTLIAEHITLMTSNESAMTAFVEALTPASPPETQK